MNTVKRSGKKVSLIINCYTVPGSKLFTKSSTQCILKFTLYRKQLANLFQTVVRFSPTKQKSVSDIFPA